jgi:TATA-box binding protein (TBP) (component of TFIID and TFIIIB)
MKPKNSPIENSREVHTYLLLLFFLIFPFSLSSFEREKSIHTHSPMSVNDKNLQALYGLPEVKGLGIVNNVALMYVAGTIDLKALMREYSVIGADYQDKKFPSVTLHFAEDGPMPHSTVKIFSAGKMLCPGCATWDAAMYALYTTAELIRRICPDVRILRAHISNVVGCMAVTARINLPLLSKRISGCHDSYGCTCTYNPKEFSGIRFHDYETSITYLIFWTGNIIITNGKQPADITAAAYKLYLTFCRCRAINTAIFSNRKSLTLFALPPDCPPMARSESDPRIRPAAGFPGRSVARKRAAAKRPRPEWDGDGEEEEEEDGGGDDDDGDDGDMEDVDDGDETPPAKRREGSPGTRS